VRPRIALSGPVLRANVRAYAALGSPVAAVVKNDGYGWGAARIAREIDDLVESYVVADEDEFWALRMRTLRPIRLLGAAAPANIAQLCAHGAIPNVTSGDEVRAAAAFGAKANRRASVRVGIIDSAGWSGISAADAGSFAALCARYDLRVELWTHITSETRMTATLNVFESAVAQFRAAGVDVAGIDCASTAWASTSRCGNRLRIGAGLFGSSLGGPVAATCAIRIEARVVQRFAPGSILWAGYGNVAVPANRAVAVLRCGYGDGFPKELAGADDILSVGMQYTTVLTENTIGEYALIDERSNLDRLASRVGLDPHELIVGLAKQS
jgi:alanine racemase